MEHEVEMNGLFAFFAAWLVTASTAYALDCTPPQGVAELRLYIGAEQGTVEGRVRTPVPGQEMPVVHTCATGTVSDARTSETQWEDFEAVWGRYEQYLLPQLPGSPLPSGGRPESYNPSILMFVTMPNMADGEAAAILVALSEYGKRREVVGNRYIAYYDRFEWQPHYAAQHPVIVFDDGQVLVVRQTVWRPECANLPFDLVLEWDDNVAAEYTLRPQGFGDTCRVNFRLLR